jgi:hypothetical protein
VRRVRGEGGSRCLGRVTFEVSDWEALNLKYLLHLLQVAIPLCLPLRTPLRNLIFSLPLSLSRSLSLSLSLSLALCFQITSPMFVYACVCVSEHTYHAHKHTNATCIIL